MLLDGAEEYGPNATKRRHGRIADLPRSKARKPVDFEIVGDWSGGTPPAPKTKPAPSSSAETPEER